jgi:hypothetical protein
MIQPENESQSTNDFEPATRLPPPKHVRKIKSGKGSFKQRTRKKPTQITYTLEHILETWNEDNEYGKSFRAMSSNEQQLEVIRMNKGAEKGLKNVIKTKLLDVNYKVMMAEKMREYLNASRTPMAQIFHVPPKTIKLLLPIPISFLSVNG